VPIESFSVMLYHIWLRP